MPRHKRTDEEWAAERLVILETLHAVMGKLGLPRCIPDLPDGRKRHTLPPKYDAPVSGPPPRTTARSVAAASSTEGSATKGERLLEALLEAVSEHRAAVDCSDKQGHRGLVQCLDEMGAVLAARVTGRRTRWLSSGSVLAAASRETWRTYGFSQHPSFTAPVCASKHVFLRPKHTHQSHSYILFIHTATAHRHIDVSRAHTKKALARSLPLARTRSSSCPQRLPSGIVVVQCLRREHSTSIAPSGQANHCGPSTAGPLGAAALASRDLRGGRDARICEHVSGRLARALTPNALRASAPTRAFQSGGHLDMWSR